MARKAAATKKAVASQAPSKATEEAQNEQLMEEVSKSSWCHLRPGQQNCARDRGKCRIADGRCALTAPYPIPAARHARTLHCCGSEGWAPTCRIDPVLRRSACSRPALQLSKITELSHASLVAAVKKVYGEAMPEEQVRTRYTSG
jgi:hypothetical protein